MDPFLENIFGLAMVKQSFILDENNDFTVNEDTLCETIF